MRSWRQSKQFDVAPAEHRQAERPPVTGRPGWCLLQSPRCRPLRFVSRRVRSEAAFGSPSPSPESYHDGLPMSILWSRMTIPASNGPPAPVGSLRLEAGTDATSGNEIIGSGESARRAGDRGRTTCGRVTVAVKKRGNHEGHEEHEGMRGGDPMSVGSRRGCVGSGDERHGSRGRRE